MAKRMFTRTVQLTHVTAVVANDKEMKMYEKEIVLPKTYRKNWDMLKRIKSMYDTDEEKVVSIKDSKVVTERWGATEEEFLSVAHKLDDKEVQEVE
jgi:hypothetical protein